MCVYVILREYIGDKGYYFDYTKYQKVVLPISF